MAESDSTSSWSGLTDGHVALIYSLQDVELCVKLRQMLSAMKIKCILPFHDSNLSRLKAEDFASALKHTTHRVILATGKQMDADILGFIDKHFKMKDLSCENTLLLSTVHKRQLPKLLQKFDQSKFILDPDQDSIPEFATRIRIFYSKDSNGMAEEELDRTQPNFNESNEDRESFQTCKSNYTAPSDTSDREDVDEDGNEQPWELVRPRRSKNKKHSSQSPVTPPISDCCMEPSENDIVRDLENSQLHPFIIHHDESVYADEDTGAVEFTKDVVSLWNVPGRRMAYIIIGGGVEDGEIVSEVDRFEIMEWDYDNLFCEDCFNYKPLYKFFKIPLANGGKVGAIVMPAPLGIRDTPCIATDCGKKGTWDENDVLVRREKQNVPADGMYQEKIFSWFKKKPEQIHGKNKAELDRLRQCVDHFDPNCAYLLAVSRFVAHTDFLSFLKIPWLRVFDFDQKSRISGLLCVLEKALRQKRRLRIFSLQDTSKDLSHNSTDWVFIKGYADRADAITTGPSHQWFKDNAATLRRHCSSIEDYCKCNKPPTLLILWYEMEESELDYLDHFVTMFYHNLSAVGNSEALKMVICLPQAPTPNSQLFFLLKKLEIDMIVIPVECICQYFESFNDNERKRGSFTLPKMSGKKMPTPTVIKDDDVAWLKVYLEALSLECVVREDAMHSMGENFLKGGELSWQEMHIGTYDVPRDLLSAFEEMVKRFIFDDKSTVFNIFHSPGGGGSTFSRRLLWNLRKHTPCATLTSVRFSLASVRDRINFLYSTTNLPVVLLVDGRSMFEVNQLFESIDIPIIILHVQRYNLPIRKSEIKDKTKILLPGKVSKNEAKGFLHTFSSFVPDEKSKQRKESLRLLTEEVLMKQAAHYVYEYGLTAFEHEFRGVKGYVKGYLNYECQQKLKFWQSILAYLSLALYYGHREMPKQFFKKFIPDFGAEGRRVMSLDLLPHQAQQFIHETERNDNCTWKIGHNIIAKEILQQILWSGETTKEQKDCEQLSVEARKRLHTIVIPFIEDIGGTRSHITNRCPDSLLQISRDVFIQRNYRDMDASDIKDSRSRYSRLLEDVESDHKRLEILSKLVEVFPEHPDFHAHLGRHFSILSRFAEAEDSLQTAVEKAHGVEDVSEDMRQHTLCRIHSMFGFHFVKRMEYLLCGRLGNIDVEDNMAIDNTLQTDLLKFARKGVQHFTQSRKSYRYGNGTYGFIGDIEIRLLITEFVRKCFGIDLNQAKDDESVKGELFHFVKESYSKCDGLIAECNDITSPSELRQLKIYYECVNYFNIYFYSPSQALEYLDQIEESSNLTRRNRITAIKMIHHRKLNLSQRDPLSVDNVHSPDALSEIVSLHEKNFQDTFLNDNNNDGIPMDVVEWLMAIRHPSFTKSYSLTDIIRNLEEWECHSKSGSMATFYCFTVYTILAIKHIAPEQKALYMRKSVKYHEKLRKINASLPKKFRIMSKEWLGKDAGMSVRNMVHRNKLGEWDAETRFWKDPAKFALLEPCTGTVTNSSEKYSGFIALDNSSNVGANPMKVFFVPKKCKFYGKRFAEEKTRVQFYIGFSINNGVEAFYVQHLKKYNCLVCKTPTEIKTLGGKITDNCPKCKTAVKAKDEA